MTTTQLDELLGDIPDDGVGPNPFDALSLEEEETPTITYDLKDTLAFLKPLVTEAHDKGKAKFVLTILALTHLVGKFPSTRKDLLNGYAELGKPGKEIVASSLRIDWFKALLERMIRKGLIVTLMDGSTRLYRAEPSQKQRLESIILDAVHNKGYEVRHLLWPNEYPLQDPVLTGPASEEATEGEDGDTAAGEEGEGDVNLIQELTAQLMTTLSPLAQHLEGIYEKLETLETKMSGHATAMEKIGPTIDQKFAEFSKQLELRTLLQSVSERLADQQSRRKSLVNQLSTNSTHEEKIMADLGIAITAVLASGTKP